MKDRLLLVAVVLPILGLLALVGRAQFNVSSGRSWVIPISGYDPRDLISGHYLRFRYRLEWDEGARTCGPPTPERAELGCCVCFEPTPGSEAPRASQWRCDDPRLGSCASVVREVDALIPPGRYFIPEEHAVAIEAALRTRDAALRVSVTDDGAVAIDHLLLDGQPWSPTR